jgi:cation diffusion facilitator family transporter
VSDYGPDAARLEKATNAARAGILVNAVLAVVKITAGSIGHAYALVADGVESIFDIFASLIVWSGLRVAGRQADPRYPFGYGKAEPLAAFLTGGMMVVAAIGISVEAVREILTPHHAPAPFTLIVLGATIAIKQWLSWRTRKIAREVGSHAVATDASHHLSDALTSTAAAIGISVALLGGPGWEPADDWAALAAAVVIAWTGWRGMRPALGDLMDRAPARDVVERIGDVARAVPGVVAIEKLRVRRAGLSIFVDIHVHADGALPLVEAHALGGRVKSEIRAAVPTVGAVTVHMEPADEAPGHTGLS